MTAVIEDEQTVVSEDENTTAPEADETEGDEKSLDFTKSTAKHKELAEYINANEDFIKANLGVSVTGELVKAIFKLRTDFNNTPEVKAAREKRKAELAEEKKQFEGLSAEAIKQEKAARRADAQAAKLEARVQEALAKAKALREGKDATGEDVAAAVEAAQESTEEAPAKRTIGRKR